MVALCSMIACSLHAIKFVDLDLPSGRLWADENISYHYYAWGEITQDKNGVTDPTTGNIAFTWETYLNEYKGNNVYLMDPNKKNTVLLTYGYKLEPSYSHYSITFSGTLPSNKCGTLRDPLYHVVADKTNAKLHESRRLPLAYDAAYNVNEDYEIPTRKDFQELFDNTTVSYQRINGMTYYIFTGSNGEQITFRAGGIYDGNKNGPTYPTTRGYYWTSDPDATDPTKAYSVLMEASSGNNVTTNISSRNRYVGLFIRPVKRNASYVRTAPLSIGLGEPTKELTPAMAAEYGNSTYISEVAGIFGIDAYRIWVDFSELYVKLPNNNYQNILGAYETDDQGSPILNYTYINKLKTLITKLKQKGVTKIAILPCNFATEKSPYLYTYNGDTKKFCWIRYDEVNNYPNRQDLIWTQNIPCPGDAGYDKFLEDQEYAYYELAWELKKIQGVKYYFEGPNERDGGIIMGNKVAGNKFTLLNSLNNANLLKSKYNIDVKDIESKGFNTQFLSKDVLARFLVDLSYHIRQGVKDANSNAKVLSPSFTTLGSTFTTLKDMYNIIKNNPVNGQKNPNKYFDILNIHPYLGYNGIGDAVGGCKQKEDWKSHLMEIYRLAVDNNHKIPVWITEMGFNTLEVSDRKAAELLKYQLDLLNYDNDLKFVEAVIVFRMIDGANCNFGIFENMYAEENLIDPNAPNKYAVENLKSGYPLKIMGQMFYFYLNPANPSNNPLPMAPEVSDLNNTVSTSNVDIFPNPTTGLVHVVCDEAQTLVRISVKDATGRTVIVNDVDGNFADVDLLLLQKGMYFVEVETNSDKTVKKIILK
jgi:hypothetical protein